MANSVIGALRVMLGMDTVEFEKGADRAERASNRMQRELAKTAKNLQSTGQTLTLALTAPLVAFGASSFKAASDAAELQSAFNQTFGDLSGMMNRWAEETGNAMGRSTRSMQELANTFGIFFNQAAGSREEAAKMSQTFAVLAQDLASFYNVTESEALQKLRSGLAGESEPLRDFGVFLSEAAVKAKGLEMGLGGVSGELSEQEKIMARYALILESTANAQGDVARTSDGTANQMRKAQAAFDELQVVVGTKLLPALTPLIEKLGAALEWFTGLPEPVQEFALVAAGLAAALGPVLMGISSIITIAPQVAAAFGIIKVAALALMANPVLLGFGAALAAIFLAWQNWDKIEPILRRLYQAVEKWLGKNLTRALSAVLNPIGTVTEAFKRMYVAVVGNSYVPDMVDGIERHFARLQGVMVAPAQAATGKVTSAARKMAEDVQAVLDRIFPEIAEARRQAEDLKTIDAAAGAGLLSDAERQRARNRALGIDGKSPVSFNEGPLETAKRVQEASVKINDALEDQAKKAEVQTVRIAETFEQMAQGVMSSLRGLVDGIRKGDFFSIFEGILGIVTRLGSAGVFGSKFQSRMQSLPAFANGGTMRLGGFGGIDRNILSLNGSPIAKVSAGETMQISPSGKGGATVVNNYYTLPSEEFWNRVDGRAGDVIGRAAPAIASAGATQAIGRIRQMQSRALA
jgi:hypothetical protein